MLTLFCLPLNCDGKNIHTLHAHVCIEQKQEEVPKFGQKQQMMTQKKHIYDVFVTMMIITTASDHKLLYVCLMSFDSFTSRHM